MMCAAKYFLAANSAEGFFSEFGRCYDPFDGWKAYIIKGGPGTGKSSFMKKVLSAAAERGETAEIVYCTGDPDSLDAVIFPKLKKVIMDGTAPHVVDPVLPGVGDEILNFGEYWNESILQSNKDEIIRTTKENKALHRSAAKFICSAGRVFESVLGACEPYINISGCAQLGERISQKYLSECSGKATEKVRYLGGVTPKGIMYFTDDAVNSAENTVIIKDFYGGAASMILNTVKETAMKRGCEVINFKNPVLPLQLLDGVYIPSASLLVLRETDHKNSENATEVIGFDDVYSSGFNTQKQESVRKTQEIAFDLLKVASDNLKQAKEVHDEIEKYYISAMDFEKLKKFGEDFCKKLFG